MKKIIMCVMLCMALTCYTAYADVTRQGNTFIQVPANGNSGKPKSEPKKTKFTYKDSQGNTSVRAVHVSSIVFPRRRIRNTSSISARKSVPRFAKSWVLPTSLRGTDK